MGHQEAFRSLHERFVGDLAEQLEVRLQTGTRAEWRDRLAAAGVPAGPVQTIDPLMHDKEHQLSCYFLPGPRPTLVEPGPESCLDRVIAALEEKGVGRDDHSKWITPGLLAAKDYMKLLSA